MVQRYEIGAFAVTGTVLVAESLEVETRPQDEKVTAKRIAIETGLRTQPSAQGEEIERLARQLVAEAPRRKRLR